MVYLSSFHSNWIILTGILLFQASTIRGSNEMTILPSEINKVPTGETLILTCSYFINFTRVRWINPEGGVIKTSPESQSSRSDGYLTISLMNLSKLMSGTYVCEGERENGAKEPINETAQVIVYDAIHLVDAPRVQNFTRNTTAEIKCIVGGDPEIRFYWEIGGIPFVDIFSSGRIFQNNTANSMLVINNIQTSDTNTYLCRAEQYTYGKGTGEEIQVNVHYAPTNVTVSTPEPALEKESVTLNCNADAIPAPTYKWYFGGMEDAKNGSATISHNGKTLKLENIREKNAGEYTCAARNMYNTAYKTTNVTVHVPPKIQFENLGPVNESERVDWECKTLKGIPKVDIGIYRNNIRLTTSNMDSNDTGSGSRISVLTKDNQVTLTFGSVTPEDAGEYACDASNKVGNGSEKRRLVVQYAPRWSSLPTTVRGCAEDKVILQCGFNGSPPPELKWFIKTNLNISSSSTPPSLLSSTNLPEMTSETQVTEAVEGFQSNEMKGLEDYRPLPIDGNYETKMNGKIFEIKKFNDSLYDTYYCMGSNMMGTEVQPIKLVETAKPKNTVKFSIPANSHTTESAKVHISKPAREDVIDTYQLVLIDIATGQEIKQTIANKDKRQNYPLNNLQHNTRYSVELSARNCKGYGPSTKKFFNTKSIVNPDPVEIKSVSTSKYPTNYTVKWTPGSTGGGKLKSFIIRYWPVGKANMSSSKDVTKTLSISEGDEEFKKNAITLSDLKASTKYQVEVTVFNQVGNATASSSFTTKNESSEKNERKKPKVTLLVVIVVPVVILLIVVDIALWISKNCGFFHCIYARTCGSAEEPSGKRDAEEGSAKYKKKETEASSTHIVASENQPLAEDAEPIANGTEQEAGAVCEETPLKNNQENTQTNEQPKPQTSVEINEKDAPTQEAYPETSDKAPLNQETQEQS